jgi:transposase
VNTKVLYMAMELSQKKWCLAFGDGLKKRQVVINANDLGALNEAILKAKEKFKLPKETKVISCYEAGRDGFWIHRYLVRQGINNHIVDSSSIKVDRRARRAKTDRLDGEKLLKQLILHVRGDEKLQVVRVPDEAHEDERRRHRERERLTKEKTGHTCRIKALLNLYGIKCKNPGKKGWKSYIENVCDWKGELLQAHQKQELLREIDRLDMVKKQLKSLETEMWNELKEDANQEALFAMIKQLMSLKGVGKVSSWILIMEWLGWRKFKNRREVGAAAGLVGSPYDSGDSQKEQGITKAGNRRIRALMVELAWSWLRYQPDSELTRWFMERFSGKRSRKIGIVALARRLLIALWRYITAGVLPEGAKLKPVIV